MGLNIGNAIQQLRHQRGVGQGELAEALGVSAQAVSKWETGKTNPDLFLLPGLAGYFGVSIDSLFEGVQDVQELPRKAAEQLEVNYQGWTELTKNDWRGTLLPNYGPYTPQRINCIYLEMCGARRCWKSAVDVGSLYRG